ncbi:Zn-ribbon domain-containing OB-fold protein [[Mycobacterium] burgundiense]|uniref:OB-fold domain-containing protein n=1 Tax=[Mycobacterium] burgundiense TaxID=3064286 RepID=A0ABN9NR90_9MYCO|nr:OB-fold domain-containing protein [Mycolicibacterium sp. MU0053]CAJ1510688.1 OB-fold domain-containing protein [Mycolicibacterium sp. MU0053]
MTQSPELPVSIPRTLPELDEWSRPFWTAGAAGELRIAHCPSCRKYLHPPRPHCRDCGTAPEFVAVSGCGTVFTFTVAQQQFHPEVPTPFVIALVELDEQDDLRLVTNIVDCDPDAVTTGMRVKVGFEQQGAVFVPVFSPLS